jgi:diguanylate cyclase (GGDEF)-like protein
MSDLESSAKPSVLIVDDQPANLMVLSKLLKEEYHVLVATNGPKALAIAAGQNPPVLMLLDIEMPEMDGYDVCRRLKADDRTSGIAVIFVSARDTVGDEEMGFRLGAVDYISKPFHPAIVRARVRNHIDLKIKTDLLEKLSKQDSLTDIPNRRNFEESLDREWRRAARTGRPLSLVMMDIDCFKSFNDHYGHGAGDECLRRVARILKSALSRPMDVVARYGGEEFVALLPDTDPSGARHVAENLRAAVQTAAIPHVHSNSAPVVTLSIGVATHGPDNPKTNASHLQQSADQALYMAKAQGRNQVMIG